MTKGNTACCAWARTVKEGCACSSCVCPQVEQLSSICPGLEALSLEGNPLAYIPNYR